MFPSISVGATISEENPGDREGIIGVGVSLPLPLWNRNKGGIETAVARRMQAEVSLNVIGEPDFAHLREKFENNFSAPELIVTEPPVGYRLMTRIDACRSTWSDAAR